MMKQPLATSLIAAALFAAAAQAQAQEGNPEAGRAVFTAKMCNMCHIVAGTAGQMADLGGSLDDVGSRRDAAWLRLYLTEPKAAVAGATMPCAGLTEQELTDIVTYLLTLKGPTATP